MVHRRPQIASALIVAARGMEGRTAVIVAGDMYCSEWEREPIVCFILVFLFSCKRLEYRSCGIWPHLCHRPRSKTHTHHHHRHRHHVMPTMDPAAAVRLLCARPACVHGDMRALAAAVTGGDGADVDGAADCGVGGDPVAACAASGGGAAGTGAGVGAPAVAVADQLRAFLRLQEERAATYADFERCGLRFDSWS